MAVGAGGGVRVASAPSVQAWGRTTSGAGPARRGAAAAIRCSCVGAAPGGLAEEHYRTLRLRPGSTRGEVKKAFRRLALMYHPDVCKDADRDTSAQFQKINVAYQMLMSNLSKAEERLEYWRLKYGLAGEDLDRYRNHLSEGDDDWLDM